MFAADFLIILGEVAMRTKGHNERRRCLKQHWCSAEKLETGEAWRGPRQPGERVE